MNTFVGENTATLDAKGRILLPAAFKKQFKSLEEGARFVLKKSVFKNCLELYPIEEWEDLVGKLRKKLNPVLNKKHNAFITQFSRGAVELTLDASCRLLLNKRLTEIVKIEKDVVFVGIGAIIEMWDVQEYEKTAMNDSEFENLAGEIFGEDFNLTD